MPFASVARASSRRGHVRLPRAVAKGVLVDPNSNPKMATASGDTAESQYLKVSGSNLHLVRGGEPLNAETLRMYSSSFAEVAELPSKVYVNNYSNAVRERVGKEIEYPVDLVDSIEDVLNKLRADPFTDQEVDREMAKAAADVFAREIAEYERRGRDAYKAYTLKTNKPAFMPRLEKSLSSRDVILHHQIGGGGFGGVFLGCLFGEVVAVKKIHPVELKSLKIEAKAGSTFSHPNIAAVLGVCLEPDTPLIVMEYMEMSLWEALHDRVVQMTDRVKLDLMAQMWRGLDYLHKMDVAHCDVKSDNVLLAHGEKGMIAKLTDFGNAIFQNFGGDDELHLPEVFSVRYAAPEILSVTPRTVAELKAADVYSLAVTCFELSTELRPFNKFPMDQDLLNLRMGGTSELRTSDYVQPRFGRHDCLERCWEVEAEERPTAEVMVAELEGLIRSGTSIVKN